MKTVIKKIWSTTKKLKNSKFETFITKVSNIEEIEEFLTHYQDLKATHNCYAYIFDFEKQIKKFSDDGEPNKSAGFAILKILEAKQIVDIIVLVRRYFQPPKLGVGQLMRGYQAGLFEYLQENKLLAVLVGKEYSFRVPNNLISLFYQWQKQYHLLIVKQINDDLATTFIINTTKEENQFPYHPEIKIAFIKNSFLIDDN